MTLFQLPLFVLLTVLVGLTADARGPGRRWSGDKLNKAGSDHPGRLFTRRDGLQLLWWNARVGRRGEKVGRSVKRWTRKHSGVRVVGLCESPNYRDALKKKLGKKWVVLQAKGDSESRNIIAAVHTSLEVLGWEAVHVGGPDWWGPFNGQKHGPRTWLILRLRDTDGTVLRVVMLHRVPGGPKGGTGPIGGKNKPAWDHEDTVLDRIITRNSGGVDELLVVGDHNAFLDERGPATPYTLAVEQHDMTVAGAGGGVDYLFWRTNEPPHTYQEA